MLGSKLKYLISAFILFFAFPVHAQSWNFEYLVARKAGQISTCNAAVQYTNARFTTRIYGDELDFLFRRDDFTLPFDKALGFVSFVFRDIDFVMIAFTFSRSDNDRLNTTNTFYMVPKKSDYVGLFDALRQNSRFTIEFPNGDSYPVTLRGSSRALNAASNCWENEQTGPLENNPFSGGSDGVNPFVEGSNGNNPFDGT
jgi:hypothetical protein